MNLRSGHATDVGLRRDNNEDAFLDLAPALHAAGMYAVADGMGGHAAGEIASREAVARLEQIRQQDVCL